MNLYNFETSSNPIKYLFQALSSLPKPLVDAVGSEKQNSSGKLNLLQLKQYQQLFQKQLKYGEKSVQETNRNAAQEVVNAQHVHQKMAGKGATQEPVPVTEPTTTRQPEIMLNNRFQSLDKNLYEVATAPPVYPQKKDIQKLDKYTTRFETTTLNDIPDSNQDMPKPKKASDPYISAVRYGLPNALYQTNFREVVVTQKPVASVASVSGQTFLDMSGNTR